MPAASPEGEVRLQYARGEITSKQYRRMLDDLKGHRNPPARPARTVRPVAGCGRL